MKRVLTYVLVLTLAFAFLGGNLLAENAHAETYDLFFAGSSVQGTWYVFCGALSEILNRHVEGVRASPTPSAGSIENIRNLASGAVDFGKTLPFSLDEAYSGVGAFENDPHKNMRGVFNCYSFPLHIIANEDSDIHSISDIEGKRIGIGEPGGGEYFMVDELLHEYGLSLDDDVRAMPGSVSDRTNALADGHVDVIFVLTGVASAAIEELTTVHDVRYVSMSEEMLSRMQEIRPYYLPQEIPEGTFPVVEEDIPAIFVYGQMITTAETDEDLVYEVVKATFEHHDELVDMMPLAGQMSLEVAPEGFPVPLHPGAEKYYREQGVIE